MSIVKVQSKGQVTIPASLRAKIGLQDGDLMEAVVSGRRITLTPKLVVDRSKFPNAGGEYTPRQRQIIDARLAEAMKSPTYGPFETHEEMMMFLNSKLKAGKMKKGAIAKVKAR